MKLTYDISELSAYINWPYFFFAWQVKDQAEKDRLLQEAEVVLRQLEGSYHAYGLFELFDAYSDGDDIVVIRGEKLEVRGERIPQMQNIPCLRQRQQPRKKISYGVRDANTRALQLAGAPAYRQLRHNPQAR